MGNSNGKPVVFTDEGEPLLLQPLLLGQHRTSALLLEAEAHSPEKSGPVNHYLS
jgi:hypothetical protein